MTQPGNDAYKSKIDSCYAYASEREVVAQLWPNLRKPTD